MATSYSRGAPIPVGGSSSATPATPEDHKDQLLVEGFIVISSLPSEALFANSFWEQFSSLIKVKKTFPIFPRKFESRLSSIRRDWYKNVLATDLVYRLGGSNNRIIVIPFKNTPVLVAKVDKIRKRLDTLEGELLAYIESPQAWDNYIKANEIKVRKFDEYVDFREEFFNQLEEFAESFSEDQIQLLAGRGRDFILAAQNGSDAVKDWMRRFVVDIGLERRFSYDLIPLRLDRQFYSQFMDEQVKKLDSELDEMKEEDRIRLAQVMNETRDRLTNQAMRDISDKIKDIMGDLLKAAESDNIPKALISAKKALAGVQELTKGALLSRKVRMIVNNAEETIKDIDSGAEPSIKKKSARIQVLIDSMKNE